MALFLLTALLSTTSGYADGDTKTDTIDFGYTGYELCEHTPDFATKTKLLLPYEMHGPNIDPAPSDADDLSYYKIGSNANHIKQKYLERLNQVVNSVPIVLVVDPNTDRQMQFINTDGENKGFTLTAASVKKVLHNETSLDFSAEKEVWLRESYWVSGRWINYEDYKNELYEELGDAAEKLINNDLLEANIELFLGSFNSEYGRLESPLYEGETLVFADIDREALNSTVLVVNDLFKFKTTDSIKYNTAHYDYQRMIGELIGNEALALYGLETNPNFLRTDRSFKSSSRLEYFRFDTNTPNRRANRNADR